MPYAHLFFAFSAHIESILIHGGYTFLAITTILEGIPLIGMVVPGHISIVVAGFLARIGTLSLPSVFIVGICGAILGDCIGYFLGRTYGMSLIDRLRPHFFISDAALKKAQDMLATHTGKAMIIGRFSPLTRGLMPFLVGASTTSRGKFWTYNIIGAASWASVSIIVGYLFGASYTVGAAHLGRFVFMAILFMILIVWGYRFINIRFHIFRKYELFVLALNLVALWGLSETIQDAWAFHPFMASFDVWINQFMTQHMSSALTSVAFAITTGGGFAITLSLGIVIGIILLALKKWRSASIILFSVALTSGALGLMKEFFMRTRPDNALQVIINDPSFPSGHAAMAATVFIVIAYLFAPKIRSWVGRELFIVACIIAIVLVGLSRIALNVHWASDVIAGWSLGIFLATASILLVRYASVLVIGKTK